jgi:hypothetical protein
MTVNHNFEVTVAVVLNFEVDCTGGTILKTKAK